MNKIIFLLTNIILFSQLSLLEMANAQVAKGGLFVEPTITYEPGVTEVNYPAPFTKSTGKARGFGVGARIGFHVNEAFFFGLDARYAMPQFEDSSVNYSAKATSSNWGPVLGIQMPDYGLRIWADYILGGLIDPESSKGVDVKFEKAEGSRIGVGLRTLSFSVNLEYQQLKYKSATLEQAGGFAVGTSFSNVNLNSNTWIAGISFPLEL